MGDWRLRREFEFSGDTVRHDAFGQGPPLVLVHGTPFSSYVWRKVVPELAGYHTVYVYDFLGYGASRKREGQDVSLTAQTRLLTALLDHWGLESPGIVGHDFGGAVTLRTHLLEQRPFSSIALIDPVAVGPWGSPFYRLVQEYTGVFKQIPAYMHRAMVAAYIRDATHKPMDEASMSPYVEPWLGEEGQDAFYRQISQNDQRYTDEVEPLYGGIRSPVLILWGEEDRWIPPEKGQQLHRAIPGSELQTLPGCAHLAQEDAPEAVAAHLREFFSRHTTPA